MYAGISVIEGRLC